MIRKALTIASLLGALYFSGCATKPEVKTGYNALETAVTYEADVRNRLWTDVGVVVGDVCIKENGMNEITNADPDTHYGRNVLFGGKKDLGTYLSTVVKTAADKVVDVKAGFRNTSIIEMLGGYGYIDVTGEKDAVNITLWYLKDFGKGWSGEFYQELELELKEKGVSYTEFQLNKEIVKDRIAVFGRAEILDLKETNYVVGVTIKF